MRTPAPSSDRHVDMTARILTGVEPDTNRPDREQALLDHLVARRQHFGITRIGSITCLDRIGIPVCQATRPAALSNCVTQGKGMTPARAAISAIMEAVETRAGEQIGRDRIFEVRAADLPGGVSELFDPLARGPERADWHERMIKWIFGWDLVTECAVAVPLALVDTVYTLPSPHPAIFPRSTTGMGAGASLAGAVLQAGFEILERHAVGGARQVRGFFDDWRIDPETVLDGPVSRIIGRILAAGFAVGIWDAARGSGLPVYWCHVMDRAERPTFAPLPAEGFACHFDAATALGKALVEACQARLSVISGAREDLTRRVYPASPDEAELRRWRRFLGDHADARAFPAGGSGAGSDETFSIADLRRALMQAGARAAVVVPLLPAEGPGPFAVRIVAPPLSPVPGGA